ncbi:MAG: hypothetical protein WBH77_08915 [Saccharofermentanales bacterium]
MITNISLSYQFLLHAKIGYEKELSHGFEMYRQAYEGVINLIADSQYEEVREHYNGIFFG